MNAFDFLELLRSETTVWPIANYVPTPAGRERATSILESIGPDIPEEGQDYNLRTFMVEILERLPSSIMNILETRQRNVRLFFLQEQILGGSYMEANVTNGTRFDEIGIGPHCWQSRDREWLCGVFIHELCHSILDHNRTRLENCRKLQCTNDLNQLEFDAHSLACQLGFREETIHYLCRTRAALPTLPGSQCFQYNVDEEIGRLEGIETL